MRPRAQRTLRLQDFQHLIASPSASTRAMVAPVVLSRDRLARCQAGARRRWTPCATRQPTPRVPTRRRWPPVREPCRWLGSTTRHFTTAALDYIQAHQCGVATAAPPWIPRVRTGTKWRLSRSSVGRATLPCETLWLRLLPALAHVNPWCLAQLRTQQIRGRSGPTFGRAT